jgi:hypothetical protein
MVDQIHGLKTFIFIVFFLDFPIHPSIICLDPSKKWPTDFLFQVCSQFRAETRGETLGSRWLIKICWRNISSYSHDITMISNILIYIYNDNYVMVYNGSSWQPPGWASFILVSYWMPSMTVQYRDSASLLWDWFLITIYYDPIPLN